MPYAHLLSTGSYLPTNKLTNADLANMVDTSHEWIVERTGIHCRHIISDQDSVCSMATAALKKAIDNAAIDPQVIDLIIVATSTPDSLMPNVASQVQRQLGIHHCPAFDLNAACSGFLYALSVADQYIRTGMHKCIAIIGSDALTRTINWQDRSTCVLFGDGAGAMLLQASDAPGILATRLHARGDIGDLLSTSPLFDDKQPVHLSMQGRVLYKYAVEYLGQIVDDILNDTNKSKEDIDWLIPHQANLRIIQATAKKLGMDMSQVIVTLDQHGNTTAASVPLALDHAVQSGKIQRGQTLLLEAFGAGITWGASLINY